MRYRLGQVPKGKARQVRNAASSSPLMFEPIVIVGAGQAAAQAVETLRKRAHRGPITLVGDEALLPYQRPPLSKKYLAGAMEPRSAAHPPRRALPRPRRGAAPGVRGRAHRPDGASGRDCRRLACRLSTTAAGYRQPSATVAIAGRGARRRALPAHRRRRRPPAPRASRRAGVR